MILFTKMNYRFLTLACKFTHHVVHVFETESVEAEAQIQRIGHRGLGQMAWCRLLCSVIDLELQVLGLVVESTLDGRD